MKLKDKLAETETCGSALEWMKDKTIKEAFETCHRGDWLLFYFFTFRKELGLADMRLITRAKVAIVKPVIILMEDQRSLDTMIVAEQFSNGEATIDELVAAAAVAADVVSAAADVAFSAASAAADAAASAAAVSAADSVAVSVASAAAAAAAAVFTAYVEDDVHKDSLKISADICREVFKDVKL